MTESNQPKVFEYEEVVHMRVLTDVLTKKKYYTLGIALWTEHTLLVTECGGLGGARLYCRTHHQVYPLGHVCTECRNAAIETDLDQTLETAEAGVTARNTP